MTAGTHTVAKRGMVLVREQVRRDFVIGAPVSERTEYTVGVVTSVTRDGLVKRFREAGWGCEQAGPADPRRFRGRVLLAPELDPEAAMAAAEAHTWPGHRQVMPFASLGEVRDALRSCRKGIAS